MRTFKNQAAQGDLVLRRVSCVPSTARRVTASQHYVVAHSETGHNHVIDVAPHVRLYDTDNELLSYLEVVESCDATEVILKHLRSFNTHESLRIDPGIYEIRRQRTYVPGGFRRAAD